MNRIQQITADPFQEQTIIIEDGTSFLLQMYFVPMQYGWFITELTYKSFVLNNLRITNSPNFLQQFRNQIPFGLACFSLQDREPSQLQDFSSGNSQIYLLSQAEVRAYQDFLTGEITL